MNLESESQEKSVRILIDGGLGAEHYTDTDPGLTRTGVGGGGLNRTL